jgi:polyphosphate kinase 2 (PPK2 family)
MSLEPKMQHLGEETNQKFVLRLESRDAAGKVGTVKWFTEHLNARQAQVVALNNPTDEERGQWYFQRYLRHRPAVEEIVLYDRSWYNRAGVERLVQFVNQMNTSNLCAKRQSLNGC